MPKKGVFEIPKWDEDLPDFSKEFKVKEVRCLHFFFFFITNLRVKISLGSILS